MIYLNKNYSTDKLVLVSTIDLNTPKGIKLYMNRNITGVSFELVPDSSLIGSCGYTIELTIDMTSVVGGSYICQLEADGNVVATEEVVIEDDVTETSNSYDGVKIIE